MLAHATGAAGLDIEKKTAFWNLSSIDPETGYAPWEVDRGILPVNDSTHIGEGFVTFHIKPCPTMQTGDTISIFANIVFDSNDSIATNRWCNMVDAGAPKSSIAFEVDSADYSHYRLRFNAQDDKGGVELRRFTYTWPTFGVTIRNMLSARPTALLISILRKELNISCTVLQKTVWEIGSQ